MSTQKYEDVKKELISKIEYNKEMHKRKILEAHGLYELKSVKEVNKENNTKVTDGWDSDYIKVYHEISDEDLNQLEKLSIESKQIFFQETSPTKFPPMNIIGYFYIAIGIMISLMLFSRALYLEGFYVAIGGLIVGSFFLSIGHVIRQLNIIINHLNKRK